MIIPLWWAVKFAKSGGYTAGKKYADSSGIWEVMKDAKGNEIKDEDGKPLCNYFEYEKRKANAAQALTAQYLKKWEERDAALKTAYCKALIKRETINRPHKVEDGQKQHSSRRDYLEYEHSKSGAVIKSFNPPRRKYTLIIWFFLLLLVIAEIPINMAAYQAVLKGAEVFILAIATIIGLVLVWLAHKAAVCVNRFESRSKSDDDNTNLWTAILIMAICVGIALSLTVVRVAYSYAQAQSLKMDISVIAQAFGSLFSGGAGFKGVAFVYFVLCLVPFIGSFFVALFNEEYREAVTSELHRSSKLKARLQALSCENTSLSNKLEKSRIERESLYRQTQSKLLEHFANTRVVISAFREGVKEGFLRKGKPAPVAPDSYPNFKPDFGAGKMRLTSEEPELDYDCNIPLWKEAEITKADI